MIKTSCAKFRRQDRIQTIIYTHFYLYLGRFFVTKIYLILHDLLA